MSFQSVALSNISIIADFIINTFQEEPAPAQDEFNPYSVHDEELKALLVSLVEDVFELVVTVAEEQSKEVVERLEETREMVMRVVRKAVLVYPTVMAVRMVTRLIPVWLKILRTVSISAMANRGSVTAVINIMMEIISALKSINNSYNNNNNNNNKNNNNIYHSDLAFHLNEIKKQSQAKLAEQIKQKSGR